MNSTQFKEDHVHPSAHECIRMYADGGIKREMGGIRRSNAEHLGNKKKTTPKQSL